MEMSTFNIKNGFVEAICRGLRSGFLTEDDYRRLASSENLDDLRVALEDTDYGTFMQDEPSPLDVHTIRRKMQERLCSEFTFLKRQSDENLSEFMDYCTYGIMIENVFAVLSQAIAGKSPQDVLSKLNPLAKPNNVFSVLATVDISSADAMQEIYQVILIDTPIGKYFAEYISDEEALNVKGKLDSNQLEWWKNVIMKSYLEDFYAFVQDIGGATAEVMGFILETEADFRTISITANKMLMENFNADLKELAPAYGSLYPEVTDKLSRCTEVAAITTALDTTLYKDPWASVKSFYEPQAGGRSNAKNWDDMKFSHCGKLMEYSFEQQFNFGVFYAWAQLREQEIRNVTWIAEMIIMGKKQSVDLGLISIFGSRMHS